MMLIGLIFEAATWYDRTDLRNYMGSSTGQSREVDYEQTGDGLRHSMDWSIRRACWSCWN
ncbi:MAG: hypothetical protein K2K19_05290 [Acetatifactor sp.]|nr:hypothetical protein [Acetatifactor sp.]